MSVVSACPRCGAQVTQEASWCALCFEPLTRFDPLTAPIEQLERDAGPRPEPVVEHRPQPVAEPRPAPVAAPLVAPVALAEPAALPAAEPAALHAAEPAAETPSSDFDVDTMFVLLAAEHRSQDPLTGVANRLDDRATRALVIGGGAVGLSILLFGVLAMLSLLG